MEFEWDDDKADYDFRSMRGVVRGKYAARYKERLRVIRLADDVAASFTDENAVNAVLRAYLRNNPPAPPSASVELPTTTA